MELESYAGSLIGHSYNAGYIILSYVVSCFGAWTALELLHRRTSARGIYNWYLLLAAASSMGAVAIWSMHFIGNRAIVMPNGEPHFQIEYNPAFTAGSFFLPICVVAIAFYFFSTAERVSVGATLLGGTLTGAAVCGMHYMGQGGISNYVPIYAWDYVLGSALIAVAASTVALSIFFYLKSTWTNSWVKRLSCASLLAVSVSGMHWVATVGTTYRLKSGMGSSSNGLSREATVVVVLCLAIGCCIVLFVLALVGQWSRKRAADRAQQVVLACATFDVDGKIMVTPEGLLPCRKITNSYFERSFDDVFNTEHPVFCWTYRASRCWQDIADLIPAIRGETRAHSGSQTSRPGTSSPELHDTEDDIKDTGDYSLLFKKLFLAAAGDLADMIQEPLDKIGVLFEDIMNTGTLSKGTKKFFPRSPSSDRLGHAERGSSTEIFGRGQLLFLIRRATRQECIKMQSGGYRSATILNVIDSLARSMEVTQRELLPRLQRMEAQAGKINMLTPGVYLSLFGLHPRPGWGLEVLAQSDANSMLPSVRLGPPKPTKWQLNILKLLDDLTVSECNSVIDSKISELNNMEEVEFLHILSSAIRKLFDGIPRELSAKARLMARPFRAPCRGLNPDPETENAYMIVFKAIADIHDTFRLTQNVEFVPLRLFLCQQHCYKDAPDNEAFANRVHREFATVLKNHKLRHNSSVASWRQSTSRPGRRQNPFSRRGTGPDAPAKTCSIPYPSGHSAMLPDSLPEKELMHVPSPRTSAGIHISNEVTVDDTECQSGERSPDIEMRSLGNHSEAGFADLDRDRDSWVDQLLALTSAARERPAGFSFPRPQH